MEKIRYTKTDCIMNFLGKLFNYKSDDFLVAIKQCRDSFIAIDNADCLINDDVRRYTNMRDSIENISQLQKKLNDLQLENQILRNMLDKAGLSYYKELSAFRKNDCKEAYDLEQGKRIIHPQTITENMANKFFYMFWGRQDVYAKRSVNKETGKAAYYPQCNNLWTSGCHILIACVDGLNGFPQAIEAVYPKTEIQQCIIHQIRNSTKFVSYKDIKKLMADLKLVYAAPTEETALNELELFKDKWDSKYPKIYKSWNDNWATLSTYFKYPEAVRRLIYTTNAIEGFNRQLRKVTKSKTVFPSDDSLLKMLYLATMDITKKWTGHRQDWGQIHSQLEIYFEERLAGRNL